MNLGLLLMAVAAWAFFLVAISAVIAIGFPIVARVLSGVHPSMRANLLRVVATAPVGFATLGVLLCFAPKLFGSAFSRVDHCFQHADSHAHFCLNHPPQLEIGAASGAVLLGFAAVAIFVGLRKLASFRRSARSLRQLAATARYDRRHEAWLIESDLPVAISVGVLRTQTLLSSGLLEMVPRRLISAIVAHEGAHERRRDGLWKLFLEIFSVGHLPRVRRSIMVELELACEQACDEEAGIVLGDRTRVAEALLAMERIRQGTAGLGPAALAFGANGLTARVESLLRESPGWRPSQRTNLGLLAVLFMLAAAAADPLHHFTETLIHYVLG